MNTSETDSAHPDSDAASTPKRPIASLPFLIIAVALGVGAYFAGPWVMTRVLVVYERERMKWQAAHPVADNEGTDEEGDYGDGYGDGYGGGADPGDGGGADPGDSGQRGGGRGRGNVDPEERFASLDADMNELLEGDEIPERMRENVADSDTDGDGAISKEEFMARAASFAGRRGRGGPGGGRGQRPPAEDEDPPTDDETEPAETNNSPTDAENAASDEESLTSEGGA